VIFLAEAFTRPAMMQTLARIGFHQSYTYFTWRNDPQSFREYFRELTSVPVVDFFRPNAWPNTPDILHEQLHGGRQPVFMSRLVLAATLAANYGIYGPAYELMEGTPREANSEEYRDSEKYQLRHWDLQRPDSLRDFIALVNRIRRENPALQQDWRLRFLPIDNEALIAYAKWSADGENVIVTVVNLDPDHAQSGWLAFDPSTLLAGTRRAPAEGEPHYQMHDLLSEQRFLWSGTHNFVLLDPAAAPAHVFRLRRHLRSEADFDYYL
jgi:starch synthase (maltosyl-transferring)